MMNSGSTNRSADDDVPSAKPVAQSRPVPAAKVEDDEPPFDVEDTPAPTAPVQAAKPASQRAEDILAMIRNRQKS
jgi:hypothetical protein